MSSKDTPEEGTPWDKKTSEKFESKRLSEYYDPCQEAANKSLKCLHRNGGDREMCTDYFQAYRDCKKQWTTERKEARKKEAFNVKLW
ncbi:cysteine alpha-hairpin motif superfamily [Halenospora varia]|nr:cysteine alpha-hairpin motif superfamily [Halenospora varia]